MIPEQHHELWRRVREFSIDDPHATIKFSDKLAFQNNWSAAYTARIIEEYKKFIFLCCILPNGASPPETVDKAWHLHLTYTQNYWKEFCNNVLQKEIHHHPSSGGPSEKNRHLDWYADTVENYKALFDVDPPADIWPLPVARSNSTIPPTKPLNYFEAYKKYVPALLIPFFIPFFYGQWHPFALTGPQFLFFYIILLLTSIFILWAACIIKTNMIRAVTAEGAAGNANIFQLARFVYGRNRAIETSVVDLAERGIIVAQRKNRFTFYPSKSVFEETKNNPVAAVLLRNYSEGEVLSMQHMKAHFNNDLVWNEELSALYKTTIRQDYYRFLLFLLPVFLGVARIIQGNSNDRPVGYLWAMLIAGGFILGLMLTQLSARKMLREIFVEKFRADELPAAERQSVLYRFVFLGIASVAGVYALHNLDDTFREQYRRFGDGTASSGSSGCGSGCGGSSCGGGGGGCGGCGGD